MRYGIILFLVLTSTLYSQNEALAKSYFKNGDYEKALVEYKKLYAKSPSNITYIYELLATYQQLEQYDAAESFLKELMQGISYPPFLVELGYNYQLKKDTQNAEAYYQKAIATIVQNSNNVFTVARSFQNHTLLDQTITAYQKAMANNSNLNFSAQLAQIYGEQGHIEKMFSSYVDYIEDNPLLLRDVKRALNDFIHEDGEHENNILFRKILLKKMQEAPNTLWNMLLSWLYIQQKDYSKAFTQEKAIYKRQPESTANLEALGDIALNDNATEIAQEVFNFLIDQAPSNETKLKAHNNLLKLEIKSRSKTDYSLIKSKYLNLLDTYPNTSQTLDLKLSYAHFLAFYLNETQEATRFLEACLDQPLSITEKAEVKLELGDILVLQEQFSKALIYYTQIQRNLKNSTISQEARFRVAKASYYKGDFKWAESQLKILKASTSQLIANDALALKLLISDNKYEDSLQTALKRYAKADLLAYQNRNEEALVLLDKILEDHKTEPIIPQALFKQAQLYQLSKNYEKATQNYQAIIDNYSEGVLVDDAYFKLAEIYQITLGEPEKAKKLYAQIIFNHADSIYFVEARKRFRALRGDAVE